jgi:hypothetical protein
VFNSSRAVISILKNNLPKDKFFYASYVMVLSCLYLHALCIFLAAFEHQRLRVVYLFQLGWCTLYYLLAVLILKRKYCPCLSITNSLHVCTMHMYNVGNDKFGP